VRQFTSDNDFTEYDDLWLFCGLLSKQNSLYYRDIFLL